MANITTNSVKKSTPATPAATPEYNNPRRFQADQDNKEFLEFLEQCEKRSKANPRKVVNVAPGFVFLTLDDGNTWSIVHDRAAREWVAYVGNWLEADPKRTKREMVASLLA